MNWLNNLLLGMNEKVQKYNSIKYFKKIKEK